MLPGKRRRSEDSARTHPVEEEEQAELPGDAEAAVELLLNSAARSALERGRQRGEHPPPPLVLPSQLYALVNDRTATDWAMQRLVERGTLRRIRIQGPSSEDALVKRTDITDAVEEHTRFHGLCHWAFDAFIQRLVHSSHEPALHRDDAKHALLLHSPSGDANEALSVLTRNGMLANEVGSDRVLIAVPSLGKAVKSVVQGRNELRATLERKQRQQALQKDLLKRNHPAGSSTFFDLKFHLRNLQGRGDIAIDTTPSGNLVRLLNSKRRRRKRV